MLTHLSLFSGIGGLDLAAEWAGFTTVGQCEWADYPTRVLEKHWPDVPRWRDIHELSARDFVHRTGIQPGELTVISGGFPCQPFSVAGNQKGKEDVRYLWPQMLRVISEIHPAYIIGENVPGILNIAADDVCKDLEREGYEVGIFDYEAAAVGAPHRRERFLFVAISTGLQCDAGTKKQRILRKMQDDERKYDYVNGPSKTRKRNVAHANYKRLEIAGYKPGEQQAVTEDGVKYSSGILSNTFNSETARHGENSGEIYADAEPKGHIISGGEGWWATEPNVGRVANGVPSRVDRLKCLGNAVVPYQAYPIFKAIADIENEIHNKPYWMEKSYYEDSDYGFELDSPK